MRYLAAWLLAMFTLTGGAALAQEKYLRLFVDPALIGNGFSKYLLPRFSLKTGIRVGPAAAGEADALLGRYGDPPEGFDLHPVFSSAAGGVSFALGVRRGGPAAADQFLEWLSSDIGRRTIERFKVDGQAVYVAVEKAARSTTDAPRKGDATKGEKLAFSRCGRCHVINRKNRYGGIGSTPSFGAMKTLPRWQQRFEAFWTLNPHPAFTQIEGVTAPFDPARPSPIAPIRLTLKEFEDLLSFIHTIKKKDLGPPLQVK